MDEEMLDLVDENDRIIGEVLRSVANVDPKLIHREIGVCLVDNQRRILIQQRGLKKKSGAGMWQVSCAGHVPKGEVPERAAHRELIEELGFDTKLTFWEKELVAAKTETHFTYRHIGKYENQKIVINKDEVEDTRLVTEAELDDLNSRGIVSAKSYEVMKRFWSRDFQRMRQAKER